MARYEEIELNGEQLPIAFDMSVILRYCRKAGITFQIFCSKLQEVFDDPEQLELLVWLGFENGHKITNKELTIKKVDVLRVDIHCFTQYIDMINKTFAVKGGNPQGAEDAKANKGKKLKKA